MIAVLGATGQLGTAFVRMLGDDAIPFGRADLDLSRQAEIANWIENAEFDLIINCAAYTAVDDAESDPHMARRLNTDAVEALAAGAARSSIKLVTFSTDYVFDGTKPSPYLESDNTNPLSVYGRTKRDGETRALAVNPEALVVRTSWVLSGTHDNFASTMIRLISSGQIKVVDDQIGRPTIVDDLAPAVMGAVAAGASGVLHLTNRGRASWYELAREVASLAGLDDALVSPCRTEEFPRPAPRPANSVLDSERVGPLGLSSLPDYRDSLPRVVERLLTR